jgi:hypothetical protein
MTVERSIAARRARAPRLLEGRVLRGVNAHHATTVFAQRVDTGKPAARATADGAPFERALLDAILEIERRTARAMGRLEVPGFSRILPDAWSAGVFTLVWECASGSVSRAAARAALAGLTRKDSASLLRKIDRRARRRQWSPGAAALALAARERGIPCEPLAGEYLRLGDGAVQQLVSATERWDLGRLFPVGSPTCVPVALVLGARGTGGVARDLDGLLRATGRVSGLATKKLTTISGRPVDPTSVGRGDGARFLLGDPRLETLVAAAHPARVLERGLRLERLATLAIVDQKGGRDVHVRGIEVGVAATSGAVVLDADSPLALRLAIELGRDRLVLVSLDASEPPVARHLAAGGAAVLLVLGDQGETVELHRAAETVATIRVSSVRSKGRRVSERRLRRAMFAMGLAFALGLTGEEIVTAMEKRRFLRG